MKKSIFLFFAAILCAMTANAYNQSAKDLYFDNSEAKWNSCYVYIGKGDYTSCYDMKRVTGTQYLWQLPANFNGGSSWNGATGWVVCKEKWWAGANESIDKYIWHGDNNVTKKSTSAWVDTKIYKTNGAANATSDGTTKKVYTITSYTKNNYTITIKTVTGGTLTVKDYDNNEVATGASKIHLTVLKFSATPASGYVLDAVEINDGTNTTTIAAADLATKTHTLTSAVTITPVWKATTSTVTVTATATNGTVTGGGVVEEGTSVTLTATPADGYQFVNWTVGGAEVSTANPYTFTAEEDITVVANFEEIPTHDITVKAFYPASWDAGKAAIHFWGDGVVSPGTPAAMEKDGDWWSYTVTGVPTTSELSVIFINGDNWNGDANQTVDITGVTESTCFEVLQSGSAKGTATKVDCESAPVIPENTYTVVGSSAPLFGEAWTPAKAENDMTLVEGTKYELVKTDVSLTVGEIQYKVAVNHAWDEAYPAENAILNISEAGKYTVTFTFDSNTKAVGATAELTEAAVVLPTVGVKGAWDGWATTTTLTGDNTSATAIVNITTADVYEFGLDVDGNFQASGATINKANNSTVVTTNAGNMKLTANVLGEYTFTWTYETKTLVVTYPAGEEVEIAKKYYIAGTENLTGFEWKENGLQLTKEGTLYKAIFSELPAGIYEFKITDGTWDNTWSYSNLGAAYEEVSQGVDDEGNPNGNIKFVTEEAKNITVIFDATAGKITLEGLTEKVVVISYVLMGVGSDWTTGIALTKNETAEYEEYVLLGQEIAEGDAVKVVTLTNGGATAWCGKVDEYSVAHTLDDNGNIVLAPGKYDFYFKVNDPATADDDIIYIGGEAYPVEPEYDMEITCTNLKTESEGNMTYFMGSDATGMEINLTILNFDGKGTYEVEGDLNAGGEWFTLAGTATYDYSEELESDVLVAEVTANGEMSLLITMYKKVLVPTETITLENMTKTIQRLGWAQTLRLDGEHETYGQVTIAVTGCDGTYGTYTTTVYLNGVGLSLTGEGEWKNDGEVDVLEVIGELEDGSKVVKVIGKTPAEEAKEPIELYADVTFTVDELGDLNLVGEANTGEVIDIWVASWADNGYGEYAAGEVWGTIDGVDVSNMSEAVTIEQEGMVAYVYALLEGADGNIYNLTAGGMAPAWAGGDDEPVEPSETITITANNLTASVPGDGSLLLKANANDADKTAIFLTLVDGGTKGYGEYGYTEYPSGLWPDVENASYGDVNLTLSEDVVAKYYQDGTIDKFEGTFLGDDNNLYILVLCSEAPATALDNLNTTVAPAKAIVNGQLVIIKNGVQYNAQGAVVK